MSMLYRDVYWRGTTGTVLNPNQCFVIIIFIFATFYKTLFLTLSAPQDEHDDIIFKIVRSLIKDLLKSKSLGP